MPIFLGWLLGLLLGVILAIATLSGAGFAVTGIFAPFLAGIIGLVIGLLVAFLSALTALIAPLLLAVLGFLLPFLSVSLASLSIAMFLFFAGILIGIVNIVFYMMASLSIAPLLPGLAAPTVLTFPLSTNVPVPGTISVAVPATIGESFARGALIGISAAANAVFLSMIPAGGPVIAVATFVVNSLAIIRPVAISRVYQGFLGWFGWLFPLSYIATLVGLALFVINLPFALAMAAIFGSPFPIRVDFTTGVIETHGGITGIPGPPGAAGVPKAAFSLGNFTFLQPTIRLPVSGDFVLASISSHETGHTLNTATMGGYVLWINAVDENLFPGSLNLAYGELMAEGHAQNLPQPTPPTAPQLDFFVRQWV
jgi:hypothetical protein